MTTRAGLLVPYSAISAASLYTFSGSSGSAGNFTVQDPGVAWTAEVVFTGGSGDGDIIWDLGTVDEVSRVFDANGRAEFTVEISRSSANQEINFAMGFWDGTETGFPVVGWGRRPGAGGLKGALDNYTASVSGSVLTASGRTFTSKTLEHALARHVIDFAPDNVRSRYNQVQIIADGSTAVNLLGSGDTLDFSAIRRYIVDSEIRGQTASARSAAALPRMVIRFYSLDNGVNETVKFRVVGRSLGEDETPLAI